MPKTPSYRKRKGYSQAIVTLTDSVTRRRRDYWLGEYGSRASREAYHRLIAEWEAADRRWPEVSSERSAGGPDDRATVAQVVAAYWRWARGIYGPGELRSCKALLRLLRKYFGRIPAEEFGPRKLKLLREEMVRGDAQADRPRRPWSRGYTNSQVRRLLQIFKWAVSREFVSPSVHQALCALEPLKRGRSEARETGKIRPASEHLVNATLPFLAGPVRALIELQLATGARPGELIKLRRADIQMDLQHGVWIYNVVDHKNSHRGHARTIYFGPTAQEILQPFLVGRPEDAYLFSPAEATAERLAVRRAKRKTRDCWGNRPGTNRVESPKRQAGDHYTVDSYRRAIQRACDMAFPPPEHLARQ